jgi:hypothetical protein
MRIRQPQIRLFLISLNLFLASILGIIPVAIAIETPLPKKLSSSEHLEFKPPLRGAPGERKDSGSRSPSGCATMLAMIPTTGLGLTASAHPTFLLYFPPSNLPKNLTLTLLQNQKNGEQEIVYRTKFDNIHGSGIASFRLPKNSPPLEIGKQYRWIFSCGAIARYGEIERVNLSPELERQLQQATPRERILLWAKNGLWYETIAELALLRSARPQDAQIANDWADLLKHPVVRLDEIISAPLMPCCSPEKINDTRR